MEERKQQPVGEIFFLFAQKPSWENMKVQWEK